MHISKSNSLNIRASAIAIAFIAAAVPGAASASCGNIATKMREILNTSPTSDTLVLAHRGLWGRSGAHPTTPENSRLAMSEADALCMDGVELDVKVTKDGIPVLMHDFNLGRTTTIWQVVGGLKYNPMVDTGTNPAVSSQPWSVISRLLLLTPDRTLDTGNHVPRVDELFDYHKAERMTVPMVFDTKTADAVRAIDLIAGQKFSNPNDYVAVKVNATLFPVPSAFLANARNITAIPVYTTNMVSKIDVPSSRKAWESFVKTMEINVKQEGGLLQGQMNTAMNVAKQRIGVFQAIPDGPLPDKFYKATGACCYSLSDIYYSGPEGRDTDDLRGDMRYLIRQGFGLITTDDPKTAMRLLGASGKRRSHYIPR